jgi:glycerate 2-kinase
MSRGEAPRALDPQLSEAIRRDAVTCALAGIAAVDPGDLVRRALAQIHLEGNVTLVAAGKAAGSMASAAIVALAGTVRSGVVISPDPTATSHDRIMSFVGGHPVPNERGVEGARAIVGVVEPLRAGDTLLCLISGGASSLMTLPAAGLSVHEVASTTTLLLRAGATIQELNCVRKHLDQLKGGRLAALAFPARVVALILSDVVGDSLPTIASGPTVADPTTIGEATSVLRAHGLWDLVPAAVRVHLENGEDESPKPGDPRLERSVNRIIGSNVTAADAACAQARSLGYSARVVTTSLTGEASAVGADIVRDTRGECKRQARKVALIFAGETTVTVSGPGSGGRNQELVLGAAIAMDGTPGMAVASLGTDGVDGPTDAAGAVADGESITRARALGLDPAVALAANDTHTFWKGLGGLVRTGPTGTNVMDIVVALAVPARA